MLVVQRRGSVVKQTQKETDMLGIIAAVLVVLWLLGFLAFHVTAGAIHILLVLAIIMFVLHLLRGRSATA
jgi:hypothetical protein